MKRVIELIEIIRNKGGCYYTQNKAQNAYVDIEQFITKQEHHDLGTALIHVEVEGASELYEICKTLFEKYL